MSRKVVQRVFELPVGILFKVAQDALVQLLFIQRRLEIDLQAIVRRAHTAHVRAGRQHQRAGHAEVCEEHLSKLMEDQLVILVGAKDDVFQRKTLHLGAVSVAALKRNERWTRRHDSMSEPARNLITRAVGARERIGAPACAERGGAALNNAFLEFDAADGAVFRKDAGRTGTQRLNAERGKSALQCVRHIVGLV